MGVIYFCAFGAFFFQIRGLLGANGILPVTDYLQWLKRAYGRRAYYLVPTLFWYRATDQMLMCVVSLGMLLSLLLMAGLWPSFLLFSLYLLYLSIISVGQDFLGFGWEVFLQEVALNAFLVSLTDVANPLAWISINFLLFRFYIQSGAVKLQSRDPNWKNLTAISYHYQSQPLPNTVAWYVHKLPMWFHKCSCLAMFVIELAVPLLIFFSEEWRLVACALFLFLQFSIWVTGNFSYLNHLTALFSLILLNNAFLEQLGCSPPNLTQSPLLLDLFVTLGAGALIVLQAMQLYTHFFPNARFRAILNSVSPFHLANRYGIFAVMTTVRYEIVVEASQDETTWKEYLFTHKPSELNRRPRRISPYQPRIDWQAWFLPFTGFMNERWFQNFCLHLLKGTPEVLKLLRHNPFPDAPPKYVRALVYVYEFTSVKEKKELGTWWSRRLVEYYMPVLQRR